MLRKIVEGIAELSKEICEEPPSCIAELITAGITEGILKGIVGGVAG